MKHLYFITLIVFSNILNAQEWIEIEELENGSILYMQDRYSEIPGSDNRKIWTKFIGSDIQTPDNKTLTDGYVLFLNEYNCSENTMIFYESIYYNSSGKMIERYSVKFFEREVDEVAPDTVGDKLMQQACAI